MIHLGKFLNVDTIQVHKCRYKVDIYCRYNVDTRYKNVDTIANVGTM